MEKLKKKFVKIWEIVSYELKIQVGMERDEELSCLITTGQWTYYIIYIYYYYNIIVKKNNGSKFLKQFPKEDQTISLVSQLNTQSSFLLRNLNFLGTIFINFL